MWAPEVQPGPHPLVRHGQVPIDVTAETKVKFLAQDNNSNTKDCELTYRKVVGSIPSVAIDRHRH